MASHFIVKHTHKHKHIHTHKHMYLMFRPCNFFLNICLEDLQFGTGQPIDILFPGKDKFFYSQRLLVAGSSLFRAEASSAFPHPFIINFSFIYYYLFLRNTKSNHSRRLITSSIIAHHDNGEGNICFWIMVSAWIPRVGETDLPHPQ